MRNFRDVIIHGLDPEAYFVEVLEALRLPVADEEQARHRAATLTPAAVAAKRAVAV